MLRRRLFRAMAMALLASAPLVGQSLASFESDTLDQVPDAAGDSGLGIMILDVGQADAMLMTEASIDVRLAAEGSEQRDGVAELVRSG